MPKTIVGVINMSGYKKLLYADTVNLHAANKITLFLIFLFFGNATV